MALSVSVLTILRAGISDFLLEATCLCVSQIPSFLTTNIVAIAAVSVAGIPATTSALVSLVRPLPTECHPS